MTDRWERFIAMLVAMLVPAGVAGCLGCANGGSGDGNGTPMDGLVCTQNIVPGITIEARDALTGAPAACGAVATIRDGGYAETLSDFGECARDPASVTMLYGAHERRGTYDILITKPGYSDWTRGAVVVDSDECHVITEHLKADLERP